MVNDRVQRQEKVLHRMQDFIKDSLQHAYTETPWRKQVRFAAIFLSCLIGLAVLAWIYLSVSSQAATIGREIQEYRREVNRILQYNADLEAQIASLSSATAMKERLDKLNLRPIEPDDIVYLFVPGYVPPRTKIESSIEQKPIVAANQNTGPLMVPEFSQSWVDVLWETVKTLEPLFSIPILSEGGQ